MKQETCKNPKCGLEEKYHPVFMDKEELCKKFEPQDDEIPENIKEELDKLKVFKGVLNEN